MSSIPGFDEDAYFGDDADTLTRPLTIEEAQAAAEYDERCRVLASTQAPLDGCEDEPLVDLIVAAVKADAEAMKDAIQMQEAA